MIRSLISATKTILFISLSASAQAAFAEAPPAGSVAFSAPTYAGSGCPQGSVAVNTSPDNQAFTLIFSSFYLAGAAGGGPQVSLQCVTSLNLSVPTGWSFSVISVDTRGYASLGTRQVKVDVNSRVAVGNNNGNAASGSLRLRGPYDDNFQLRAEVNGSSGRWSACSDRVTRVKIDTEIKLKREALAAVDSLDGQVQGLALAWKRCR